MAEEDNAPDAAEEAPAGAGWKDPSQAVAYGTHLYYNNCILYSFIHWIVHHINT